MPIAYAGAAVGIASGINSLTGGGGGGSGGPAPQISGGNGSGSPFLYQPTGQPQQDANYQAILAQYNNISASGLPQALLTDYGTYAQAAANNPYGPQAQAGATGAADLARTSVVPQQVGGAAGLYGAGNTILNTAFDPQSALYNRTQQHVGDQANALNAMYGLSSSPYGAGVAGKTLSDFNIDWQNQQLGRQLQGVTGAGRAYAGAADLGTAAINTSAGAANLPYATYMNQQKDYLGAIDALSRGSTSAFALPQLEINDIRSYLGLGQSAGNDALAGQQQGFSQGQTNLSNIGYGLGQLSSLFGPNTGGGNPGADYSGLSYSGAYQPNSGGFDTPGGFLPATADYNAAGGGGGY